jgi:hypothetical protein
MFVPYGEGKAHQAKLRRGLKALGPDFVAHLCWWCDGLTTRDFGHCDVCGKGRFYGSALGVLIGNTPAPESVVNQILVAAERSPE